ncbi:GntR family transcriptional regulator [Cryobacterium sp. Y11]|uniref:GntR family transcriptional regulator n=1 Tax=Cryobacterium sp. Y11 TaxID=2045016 RepID=UPI001304D9B3|nr:GntR family transcriptional regulator [Cryobacterium sp. Y11]
MSTAAEADRARLASVPGQPLWLGVHDDILGRIASGECKDTFPGKIQLTAEYQVSRSTVRLALNPLRREGLVSSSRGKRPVVHVNHGEEHRFGPVYILFAAVEAS